MSRTSATRPRTTPDDRAIGKVGAVGVLMALSAGVLLAAGTQTAIAGALPDIGGDIGTIGNLSWPVTAYLVTEAVAVLVFGKLAVVANPRPVYLVSMSAFVAGAVLAGLSPTMGQLIVSRAIQGIGAGGLLVLGFEVVRDLASPLGRARYRSWLAIVWSVGTLLGPLVGGLITEHLGWRWVFYLAAPIGVLVVLAVACGPRLPRRSGEVEVDLIGAVLLTLALVLVLVYLTWQGPLHGWIAGGGLVVLAETIAALVLLPAWEKRVKNPLLPFRLLGRFGFLRVTLTAVLPGAALFGVLILFPLYAQVVLRTTPTWAGILVLPMTTAAVAGAAAVFPRGWCRPLIASGTGTVLLSTLLLARLPVDSPRWQTLVLVGTAGLGLGIAWQLAVRIARSAALPDEASKTIPAILFLQIAGCVVGAALAGTALSTRLGRYRGADLLNAPGLGPDAIRALPDPAHAAVLGVFQHAAQQVLLTAVVIAAVAFVLSLTVRPTALRSSRALAAAEPEPVTVDPDPAESAATNPETTLASAEPEPVTLDPDPGTEPEPTPEPVETTATKPRRSPVRRLAVACCAVSAILAAGYVGGLIYAGPGILRGTNVHGVDIGGLQPDQAELKLDRTLGPASDAPVPVLAGNQRLALDPHNAGLGIDVHDTVVATARRTTNPVRLADILVHAPRRVEIRTTVDGPRLTAALVQLDHQVHRDPRNGTIDFSSGMPQAVPSQYGQSLDVSRSTAAVRNGYLKGQITLPLTSLRPEIGNDEVGRAMREFAEPAVSGPVVVSADGRTATLQPSVFARHLSMTPDGNGRLRPKLDGAGVLSDAGAELGPLQTQPQQGGVRIRDGQWIRTPSQDGHIIKGDDLAGSMLRVLPQPGYRVAYVPLTTVHP